MSATLDIVSDPYVVEQQHVEATLNAIMESVRRKDFARLADFHLDSPKFTKFDDVEPLDRQDINTANRSEEEGLGGVENFEYDLRDLKIDVFGPTAVATFIFGYRFEIHDEAIALRARTTMVFVNDRGRWKIAHEHLSPFMSNL
jgi:ketosteroid isomerase-like protein